MPHVALVLVLNCTYKLHLTHLRCLVYFNTEMASHKQEAVRSSAGNKALRRGGDAIFAGEAMSRKLFADFGTAWAQAYEAIDPRNAKDAYRKESILFHTAMCTPLHEPLPSTVEQLFGKQHFVWHVVRDINAGVSSMVTISKREHLRSSELHRAMYRSLFH